MPSHRGCVHTRYTLSPKNCSPQPRHDLLPLLLVGCVFVRLDPVIGGKALAANIGCDVPYYTTPYNTASRITSNRLSSAVALLGGLVTAWWLAAL